MTAVWKLPLESHTQKLVLLSIADCSDDQGNCFPHIETLATKCSLSPRAVIQHIKALCGLGVLEKSKKIRNDNRYRVVVNSLHYSKSSSERGALPVVNAVHVSSERGALPIHEPSENHQVEPSLPKPPNGASEHGSNGSGTTGNGNGKKAHPFAGHAEAFAKAFKETFGDDYKSTAADWVQGSKFVKDRPTATPEHLVKLATYHWGRGEFTPKASLTLKGICTQWTTLRAQYQKDKPGHTESAPEPDEATRELYGR